MGLECNMWQVTPDQLDKLKSSDEAVEDFIDACYPVDPDEPDERDTRRELYFNEDDLLDDGIGLEKIWHLLHYLITGDPNEGEYPLSCAIMCGRPISEDSDEISYLLPDDVKEVAKALSALNDDDLRSRFNPDEIIKAKIYRYENYEADEHDLKEVLRLFHKLRKYYKNAAKKGNAIIHHFW